jgi:hypothetical protein
VYPTRVWREARSERATSGDSDYSKSRRARLLVCRIDLLRLRKRVRWSGDATHPTMQRDRSGFPPSHRSGGCLCRSLNIGDVRGLRFREVERATSRPRRETELRRAGFTGAMRISRQELASGGIHHPAAPSKCQQRGASPPLPLRKFHTVSRAGGTFGNIGSLVALSGVRRANGGRTSPAQPIYEAARWKPEILLGNNSYGKRSGDMNTS